MIERPWIPNRQSIRLPAYDYSRPAVYFVTIQTENRQNIFGDINNGLLHLNEIGLMVENAWRELSTKYSFVIVDEFVVMPNHFHGIIEFVNESDSRRIDSPDASRARGESHSQGGGTPPLRRNGLQRRPKLGNIIAYFKYQTTKSININNEIKTKIWQRNYYERIIRNDDELNRTREYIQNNPINWKTDEHYSP